MQENEKNRLSTLRKYDILDTPPDGTFDEITSLAARIFNVPIAIISLVDEDRIWFKSRHGIENQEINRDPGLCSSAILSDDIYLVEDARNDPRCLSNPLVAGEYGLQFYAAAPLVTHDGFRIGTFCILDKHKRFITDDHCAILTQMSRIVMQEIEIRLQANSVIRNYEEKIKDLEGELKSFS